MPHKDDILHWETLPVVLLEESYFLIPSSTENTSFIHQTGNKIQINL